MKDLEEIDLGLVLSWSAWLRAVGATEYVLNQRRQRLIRFARWLPPGSSLLGARPEEIERFLDEDDHGSRKRRVQLNRAFVDFYRWALEQELLDEAPLDTSRRSTDRGWMYRDSAETAELLEGFQIAQERRHLARPTIASRRAQLRLLADWMAPRSILYVSAEEIEMWLDGRQLGPRARYTSLSHLHAFFRWAVKAGHTGIDPTADIERPRLPQMVPRPIRDDDLRDAIHQAPPEIRAWLTLAAFAGLRCQEIAGLASTDVLVDRPPGMLLIRDGKGAKERILPVHPEVAVALRVIARRHEGPLFVSQSGRQRTGATISQLGNQYLHSVGIAATMHKLRHWFGTRLYADTLDLRLVQEMLGHSSPTTTAGYAAYSPSAAVAGVLALSL